MKKALLLSLFLWGTTVCLRLGASEGILAGKPLTVPAEQFASTFKTMLAQNPIFFSASLPAEALLESNIALTHSFVTAIEQNINDYGSVKEYYPTLLFAEAVLTALKDHAIGSPQKEFIVTDEMKKSLGVDTGKVAYHINNVLKKIPNLLKSFDFSALHSTLDIPYAYHERIEIDNYFNAVARFLIVDELYKDNVPEKVKVFTQLYEALDQSFKDFIKNTPLRTYILRVIRKGQPIGGTIESALLALQHDLIVLAHV